VLKPSRPHCIWETTMTDRTPGRPRVFLACTTDARSIAEALGGRLEEVADVTLWSDPGGEGPGTGPRAPGAAMTELLRQARLHDFLALVLGTGDLVARGGAPRDTVLFEAGLLVGALGGERSLVTLAPGAGAETLRLPADLFDGSFAPPWIALAGGGDDLAAAAATLRGLIAERWAAAPPALLPSTGIAIGYFRNFVKPVCDYLAGGDVAIGEERFTGPDFHFTFDIIIPATLEDATPAGQQRFWARNAGRLVARSLSIRRRYPFFIHTGPATNPLRVVDYPTPLAASVDAVALVLRREGGDREELRALLGAREIDNFEATLAALVDGDRAIADRIRIRRLASDADLTLD
jgi:hypothetical protein